jgi:hypothetical protein
MLAKTLNREPIKLYFNLYVIKENKNRKQCETYQKEYKRNYIRKQTKMEIDKSGAPGKARAKPSRMRVVRLYASQAGR